MENAHSIRFRRGSVEFELTGSGADVARAWESLSEAIAQAFADPTSAEGDLDVADEHRTPRRRKAKRKGARTAASAASKKDTSDRTQAITSLLEADLDSFPELGSAPTARYAGYALLSWAKKTLDIDGLTVNEMSEFFQERFGIPNTAQAYREAFRGRGREIIKSGTPAVFRLMKDGKTAIDKYIQRIASGASAHDAAAATDKEAKPS